MNIAKLSTILSSRHEIIGIHAEPIKLKKWTPLSHFYINWRKASNDAFLLDQLSDYVTRSTSKSKVQHNRFNIWRS
jgi:hypothetical protein